MGVIMKWHHMSLRQIKELVNQGYEFTPQDIRCLRNDVRATVRQITGQWERMEQEKNRVFQLYRFERELYHKGVKNIAGVDEAGRGPLAGPVVAAAVILPPECFIAGINDSKKISETKRYILEKEIKEKALCWAVGAVGAHDIDRINIFQAACLAMKRAIKKLRIPPGHLLIDAIRLKDISISQTAIIKGDAQSASIAAASIVAKCHRDRLMKIYDSRFPGYGFARHKGYPTVEHIHLINTQGTTCIHRKSFHVGKTEK